MNFDSAFFIACFLPLVCLLHCIPGRRWRNALLTAAGLVFYSFGSLKGLALLLAVWLVNFSLGLWVMAAKRPKIPAATAVVFNLGFLGAYKYLDFVLSWIPGAVLTGLVAPIGISFFTFKCVSYIIDTCRNPSLGTKKPFELLLYISFFPQLMAGPITRFREFQPQIGSRSAGAEMTARGLRRFITGLGKKLILSAAACRIADAVFALDAGSLDIRLAWLGAAAYTLQIYFDFSGYSDMAIGLGRVFGFETGENFDYPYISASVTEFWRRWHISLSAWFRDYVYIPLGGNRRGKGRAALNKFIVFALCGLWHGAAWTFILWGLWHGLLCAIESLGMRPKNKVIGRIYTLLAVCVGFVMFRAAGVGEGFEMLSAMFTGFKVSTAGAVALRGIANTRDICLLLLSAVFCTPVKRLFPKTVWTERLSYICALALLAGCIMALAVGGFSPFIYFQF